MNWDILLYMTFGFALGKVVRMIINRKDKEKK